MPASSSSATTHTPDGQFRHATIQKACRGATERAYLLVLGEAGTGCGPVSSRRVTVLIPASVKTGKAVRLGPGAGSGRLCPAGGGLCQTASSGSLELDRLEAGKGAKGRVTLALSKGALHVPFDARWCKPSAPLPCEQ